MKNRLHNLVAELRRRQGIAEIRKQWAHYRDPSVQPTKDDPWLYIPHKPTVPQQKFLELTCKEALYGGAAGGGKSDALLMNALQWVHIPGYSALIIRKSFTDLTMPGGLIDRSSDWLNSTAATWRADRMCWTFPSGARLVFGHLADDGALNKYQGAHFHYIGFDELTQHPEKRYTYLLSRNRRHKNESEHLPEIMRATSNPGGTGHDWVYKRFIRPYLDGRCSSEVYNYGDCVFIPAKLDDNPHLDREAYRASLQRMDSVTRRQLLEGDWEARPADVIIHVDSEHLEDLVLDDELLAEMETVLSVDLGTREDEPTTAFVVVGWLSTVPNHVWVLHASKDSGMTPSAIGHKATELLSEYDSRWVVVDPGGLGKGYIKEMRLRHGLPATPAAKSDKLGHIKLLVGAFEQGHMTILSQACEPLIEELEILRWNAKGDGPMATQPDHCFDALLYGYRHALAYASEPEEEKPSVFAGDAWAAEQEREEAEEAFRAALQDELEDDA